MIEKEYELSSDDIEKLENQINELITDMENFSKKVVEEAAYECLKLAEENHNALPYKPTETMEFTIEDDSENNSKNVIMRGSQAIYSEFGTGTMGERSPHPIKSDFGLDGYNSHIVPNGTIRYAKASDTARGGIPEGELFWTYQDENGEWHYTQGVPAGKQMYNAANDLEDTMPSIIEKVIDETMESFK